jgi:hypothetical protein
MSVRPVLMLSLVTMCLVGFGACAPDVAPERPFSCDTASRCPTVRRDADDVAACEAELGGPCGAQLRSASLCRLDKEECTPDGKQDLEKLERDCRTEDAALEACRASAGGGP